MCVTDQHAPPTAAPADASPRRRAGFRLLAAIGAAAFVTFWVWALFFASKEPVNAIGDTEWTRRAQSICERADAERVELADFRVLEGATAELVRERADIVDHATDILEGMLDAVVAVDPSDPKGQDLIPQWEADYRAYLATRRTFADDLRATGENRAFSEPEADSIPVSEKLSVFAADNEMTACAPPSDLSR